LWLDPLWVPLAPVALFMPTPLLGPADPFTCHVCDGDNFHGDLHITFTGTWTGIPAGGTYGDRLDSITTACAALSSTTYVFTAVDDTGAVCQPNGSATCINRWVYSGSFDFGADCTAHDINMQVTLFHTGTYYSLTFTICWCGGEPPLRQVSATADDTALSPYKDMSGKLVCGSISGLSLQIGTPLVSRDCCICVTSPFSGDTVYVNITAA